MATASARELQQLPVITNAAAPEVDTDEVSKIIAICDAALDAHRCLQPLRAALGSYTGGGRIVAFFADRQPHAEYTLTLWASARQLAVSRHTSKYDDGTQIRALEILIDGVAAIAMQWPKEQQPVEAPEPTWRPSDGPADNDEQPITGAAIRDALRAPHWTDEATTSLDATDAEVRTVEVSR